MCSDKGVCLMVAAIIYALQDNIYTKPDSAMFDLSIQTFTKTLCA